MNFINWRTKSVIKIPSSLMALLLAEVIPLIEDLEAGAGLGPTISVAVIKERGL